MGKRPDDLPEIDPLMHPWQMGCQHIRQPGFPCAHPGCPETTPDQIIQCIVDRPNAAKKDQVDNFLLTFHRLEVMSPDGKHVLGMMWCPHEFH